MRPSQTPGHENLCCAVQEPQGLVVDGQADLPPPLLSAVLPEAPAPTPPHAVAFEDAVAKAEEPLPEAPLTGNLEDADAEDPSVRRAT